MTLIFKQTIKLCKDAQCDVKPGGGGGGGKGGGGGGGQTWVCMCTRMLCMHVCVVMQKYFTKCMFTCSIGMLNIGSVMQL